MTFKSHHVNWRQNQPAPIALIKTIRACFPQVRDEGIYVPRNIRGTKMQSPHAEGRAVDIGLRADLPNEKLIGDQLFRILIDCARRTQVAGKKPGQYVDSISAVIWNRHIWSAAMGGPRPWVGRYKGGAAKNPHTDHIHVEWTRAGSLAQRMRFLELQINLLRQGLEELSISQRNMA